MLRAPLGLGLLMAMLLSVWPGSVGAETPAPTTAPTTAPAAAAVTIYSPEHPAGFLLHLPGIAGWRRLDDLMLEGLRQGGLEMETAVYDWTGQAPGLTALLAVEQNKAQATHLARTIETHYREHPERPIYITAHSGGAGLAVWALEQLPDEVQVQSVVFLAPALSPRYDLSPALGHVRGNLYVVSSEYDVVLGTGTRLFGTIDGVKSDAAGRVGFTRPETADVAQYAKIVAMPYQPTWSQFHNIGDHIGPMMRPFAREVLAPLVAGMVKGLPTSRPASPEAVH